MLLIILLSFCVQADNALPLTNFAFKTIPAGSYLMGENDQFVSEVPVHRVEVKQFKLMENEVTQAHWAAVMGELSIFKASNHPVYFVNWGEVQEFIMILNTKTGKQYRLPSEAEWEYAARAGSVGNYSWGNNDALVCEYANYADELLALRNFVTVNTKFCEV